MPAISIVIPTLGRSDALDDVIAGLAQQRPELLDAEVIIVADGRAKPPTPPAHAGPGTAPTIRMIQAGHGGASAARNAGWRSAQADLILFLDDDIVPTERLVAEHLSWHERHPELEVGVLGYVRWSPRVKVTPFMRWLEQGIQFDYGKIQGGEVDWYSFYSCNVSVKRAMLDRVGGFDEQRFPFGYEDLDLARRMSEHGFTLLFNQAAVGEHLKTETLDGWRRNLRRIAQAERRFTHLYPDAQPYFYDRFQAAAEAPTANGRSARFARFVAPGVPWLGPFVWRSYDLVCRQRLAPEFLSEWEAAPTAGSE